MNGSARQLPDLLLGICTLWTGPLLPAVGVFDRSSFYYRGGLGIEFTPRFVAIPFVSGL